MRVEPFSESVVGFIGIGVMGQPMAMRLLQSGIKLHVWNRSAEKCDSLRTAGAIVHNSADALIAAVDIVFLMLATPDAMDAVLGRGAPGFAARVAGKTLVHMGTTSAAYSEALGAAIEAAGGHYVECPVSGSRKPAEAGALVAMLAGKPEVLDQVEPLLPPMCKQSFRCGPVPGGLNMKLAVNLFLITMVTGLCEAFHLAQRQGLNSQLFAEVIAAGPMSSAVSSMKLAKLVSADFGVQASIHDVFKNCQLVASAARSSGINDQLVDRCESLFSATQALGFGDLDMIGVIKAMQARTAASAMAKARS